jgi:hypothetical protein
LAKLPVLNGLQAFKRACQAQNPANKRLKSQNHQSKRVTALASDPMRGSYCPFLIVVASIFSLPNPTFHYAKLYLPTSAVDA